MFLPFAWGSDVGDANRPSGTGWVSALAFRLLTELMGDES